MTIAIADINRFKNAFKGTVATQETPMLSHRAKVPECLAGNERVQQALEGLDLEMDTMASDARDKRTGKRALGTHWTLDRNSSLKKVSKALEADEIDLDALSNIQGGKGQAEAQQALEKLKTADKRIQQTVATELLDMAAQADSDPDCCERINDLLKFLGTPGVQVPGAYEQAVEQTVEVLAKGLGMSVEDLSNANPEVIRASYVDRVYAKLKMDNKTGRDPGVGLQLHKAMEKLADLAVQNCNDRLQDGSHGKALLLKLQTAGVGNTMSLNSAESGKFGLGPVTSAERTLDDPEDSNKTCKVTIKGNQRFVDGATVALDKIADTAEGQALLKAFAAAGKKLNIAPPSIANAQRLDENGAVIYGNSGAIGRVAFDPENDVAGDGGDTDLLEQEPWRRREPSVALYHEMIHALLGNQGGEGWVSSTDPNEKLRLSDQGDITELRIVGIDYRHRTSDGRTVLFPFSDPAYNPMTENQYRRALARAAGEDTYLPRPSYANLPGQVKLNNGPAPV